MKVLILLCCVTVPHQYPHRQFIDPHYSHVIFYSPVKPAKTILLERMPELLSQFENRFITYDSDEAELDENGLEVMESSLSFRKVKTSRRPLRSVLYYMKGHESTLALTPVQLPPRSKILQV